MKTGSPAFKALSSVVDDKQVLSDLKFLGEFPHTGNLEVYHLVINKYCPRRLHFSMNGMIVRTQLAVMDFNDSMCKKQATTADGSLSYKQVFSCVTQSWVVKKVLKKENRSYLEPLLRLTPDMTPDNNKNYLPILGDIPKILQRKTNQRKQHQ